MPEYPDVVVYIEGLEQLIAGERLVRLDVLNPFVLRSFDPPPDSIDGKRVQGFRRIGKRILFQFEEDIFLVLHLMIAGRLQWKPADYTPPRKLATAVFHFRHGTLVLTEAGTQKRASIHLIRGEEQLSRFDRGGVEIFECNYSEFKTRLLSENHTLKRALTDPKLFSGIGNAYSDEILHLAKLSPILQTKKMTEEEIVRLFDAVKTVLQLWTDRLRAETGNGLPQKVTAFRPEMAVHGKFGRPCPTCSTPVQRIRYASNETNYCPTCQTGGRILADRSLSRLLKKDWPRTIEELENHLKF